jgi:ribosomal protein S18 acetylase RimI-like enzyme
MGQVPQCGLMVVNLETGAIEQSLILGGTVEELYDVLVLPGVQRPKALGFQDEDIERLVNFPGAPGLITTKPALKRDAKGPAAPIPGLPTQERLREERPFSAQDLKYQRVYHLNPESLLPYDDMTYPSLAERWRRQGQRGELVGVSVSLWGELLGFVIGEKLPFGYAQGNALDSPQRQRVTSAQDATFGDVQGNAIGGAQVVEIISFKVDARYRRRGLGKELMATLERQLAKEGIAQLTLTYDAHPQICQTLEPLLAQLGWAPPQNLNAQQKRGFKPLGAGLTPSLEALFAQGTAAAERGDAAQAVAYYQQALTLDPQSAPIH